MADTVSRQQSRRLKYPRKAHRNLQVELSPVFATTSAHTWIGIRFRNGNSSRVESGASKSQVVLVNGEHQVPGNDLVHLACKACSQTGVVRLARIQKCSVVVVAIGWFLCSAVLVLVLLALWSIGLSAAWWAATILSPLAWVGQKLVQRKDVRRCTSCGAIGEGD